MANSKVRTGTLIIGISLVLSRILGILRDVLLADFVGVGTEKNAYDLAFLIPDILNHLISTGFLSITFIPIFTGYWVKNKENEAWDFFSNVLTVFTTLLVALTILAWIFVEPLILLLTSANPDPETVSLAVKYSRIILPAQIFFFVGAILTSIQHIKMNFFIPALTGLIYNLSIILGGVIGNKAGNQAGVDGFVWGVVIGAFLGSVLVQLVGAKRSGAKFRFQFNPWHRDLYHYCKITLPLILGVGTVFAMQFVYLSFGSEFGENGISLLGYAYRIMFAIVAVFGFAVGVASYPVLAKLAKKNALDEINKILYTTLSKILAILAPSVLIVWFLAEKIVQLMFERGAFNHAATEQVANLLKWYLLGAFAMSSQILIVRCFYAMEKTWLPALTNTGAFLVFLPFYKTLGYQMGIAAIPFLSGLCAITQVVVLLIFWVKISGWAYFSQFARDSLKIFLAILIEFTILYFMRSSLYIEASFSTLSLIVYLGIFSFSVIIFMIILQLIFKVSSTQAMVSGYFKKFKFIP